MGNRRLTNLRLWRRRRCPASSRRPSPSGHCLHVDRLGGYTALTVNIDSANAITSPESGSARAAGVGGDWPVPAGGGSHLGAPPVGPRPIGPRRTGKRPSPFAVHRTPPAGLRTDIRRVGRGFHRPPARRSRGRPSHHHSGVDRAGFRNCPAPRGPRLRRIKSRLPARSAALPEFGTRTASFHSVTSHPLIPAAPRD